MVGTESPSLTQPRFQFRLGKLLGATAVVALACGWWSDHVRQVRRREYAETMLKAYQTRFGTEQEELLVPSAPLRNNFRNIGVGRGASPDTYASAEEFVEDLRAAADGDAFGKVRWRAQVSGVIDAATPELIRLLKSPNAEWRERAAILLGEGSARKDEIAVALAGALTDVSFPVRRRAAVVLAELGTAAKPAAAELAAALQDPEPIVRAYAADALWKATKDRRAVAELIALLDGPPSDASLAAIDSLGRIGPKHAAGVAPKLIRLLDAADILTRESAILAVAKLAPRQTAVKAISEAFERLSGNDRQLAAATLVELDRKR